MCKLIFFILCMHQYIVEYFTYTTTYIVHIGQLSLLCKKQYNITFQTLIFSFYGLDYHNLLLFWQSNSALHQQIINQNNMANINWSSVLFNWKNEMKSISSSICLTFLRLSCLLQDHFRNKIANHLTQFIKCESVNLVGG